MNASQQTADEVAERLFGSLLGTVEILSVYLGDRLGWYRSLAADGPASAVELAQRTDTQVRYAREWLEQQAVAGLLVVESDGAPDDRRFAIPASTAEVMTEETSLAYLAPFGRMFGAVWPVLPQLLEEY
ncbi:MAG: methyltransferase protein, partial [Nocardioides sp.]|nr:methyltransferase protein [Nocardioides sp.]